MQQAKTAIGRIVAVILLALYTPTAYSLSLLQIHSTLSLQKEVTAQTSEEKVARDTDGDSEKNKKRTVVAETSDLEAVIGGGVQYVLPKYHLQVPAFFALLALHELPAVRPPYRVAFSLCVEVLFETLILPNAP